MIRRSTLFWLIMTGLLGFGLYQIKYEVQFEEEQLARINKQILEHEEAIQVLDAEWSYLNRPDRLAEMARRYLEMSPVVPAQFTDLAKLPDREAVAAAAATAAAEPKPRPVPVKAAVQTPPSAVAKPAAHTQALPARPAIAPAVAPAKSAPPRPAQVLAPPKQAAPLQKAAYAAPPPSAAPRRTASVLAAPGQLLAGVMSVSGDAPFAFSESRESHADPK